MQQSFRRIQPAHRRGFFFFFTGRRIRGFHSSKSGGRMGEQLPFGRFLKEQAKFFQETSGPGTARLQFSLKNRGRPGHQFLILPELLSTGYPGQSRSPFFSFSLHFYSPNRCFSPSSSFSMVIHVSFYPVFFLHLPNYPSVFNKK